jgi:hypothetical protein
MEILMANTLHFIQKQQKLMRRLLSVADRFLIVEYERSKPNRSTGFERLRQLFTEAGVERVEKLAIRPSLFGGTMYSALGRTQYGHILGTKTHQSAPQGTTTPKPQTTQHQ